jgi:hypothetical protein
VLRLLFLALLLLQGCSASSVFVPYPDQASAWVQPLSAGQPGQGAVKLEPLTTREDGLLYLQELARLQQLDNQLDASRATFADVFAAYEQQDAAATVQASALAAGTASLMTNDNALPYEGYAYERIMAHAYQALNYLGSGDVEGAQVELRRAALEQRVAQQRNEKRIARAEEKASEQNVDPGQFESQFAGLNAAAAEVRSAITNAWTFYLSGAVWEATGEYNSALVDYKQALQIQPDSPLLKAAATRAAAKVDGRRNRDRGTVVILHEQGLVPPKREISFPVPTIHGWFAVAFPTYQPQDMRPPKPVHVRAGDSEAADTEVLAQLNAMAARALKDRVPAMLVRQTLRATAKYQAQKTANDNFGLAGALFTQIYNLVSERADLRSWLSLPAYGMAAEVTLPAGEQSVQLSGPGGGATLTVPVRGGGVTIVRVVTAGSLMHTDVYAF